MMASRVSSLLRAAAAAVSVPGRSRSLSAAAATAAKKPAGDYVPVYVAMGMIAVSVSLGLATARQQLAHAPNVRLDKKKRETDDASLRAGVAADPVAEYPARKAVTLKDAGVEPPGIEQGREGILEVLGKKTKPAAAA
ncbi:hypothetical protein OsJ_34122 [Oryza sativa Japonica Group]|uniref:Uncharacterized protein n=1 Tax=Oryza sativa subsp. japonica TaxID=39947 RepID=B9GB11_ORYSJ|nr:hypothetical protein OsJ_34122 [Oryza sativa Japonica Group]